MTTDATPTLSNYQELVEAAQTVSIFFFTVIRHSVQSTFLQYVLKQSNF